MEEAKPAGTVVIIPVFEGAATIGATVGALREYLPSGHHPSAGSISEIVVVDDGSTDDSAAAARDAGARVVVLPSNVGKGGAVAAGRDAAPSADRYLLVDADLGTTASHTVELLEPVATGAASMTVAVFPATGRSGGFGLVSAVAATVLTAVTGERPAEPLSGQRAIDGSLFRSLELAPRFGLEVGLSMDVWEAGGRTTEIPLQLAHRPTGRTLSGFAHRFAQGRDMLRAVAARRGWYFTIRQVLASRRVPVAQR